MVGLFVCGFSFLKANQRKHPLSSAFHLRLQAFGGRKVILACVVAASYDLACQGSHFQRSRLDSGMINHKAIPDSLLTKSNLS